MAVTHRGIHNLASLRMPRRQLFGRWSVCYLLHRRMLHRTDKNLAAAGKCHLTAVGRQRAAATANSQALGLGKLLRIDIDCHLAGFASVAECINFTVIAEHESPVGCLREKTHRMCCEFCHLHSL